MTTALHDAAAALAEALAAENAALAAFDLGRAAAMLPAKQAAADALAALLPATPEDAARPLAARLRDLLAENRVLLERAIRVQGRVLRLVAQALPQPLPRRYGATGAAAAGSVTPVIVSARA
jgi:hypothetical protein